MIDINMYGVPKKGSNSNVSTLSQIMMSQNYNSGSGNFAGRYIWGQYFDGSKNIDGDMKVNGTASIDHIKTLSVDSTYLNSSYTDFSYLQANYGKVNNLSGKRLDFDWANILKGYIDDLACKGITTENLTVTGSAHFFELIIDQIKASGGAVIFTAANGFTVRKVDKITEGYRLYFLAEERGTKIRNMWRKNDQAICQNFNRASKGTNYNISNKYYWALVLNTNNEENEGDPINVNVGTVENIDVQPCHYIDISDNDFDGTLNPEVDDEIAMLGYRGDDDEARKNAIYISSYSSLDNELKAPLFVQYKGIDDYDLTSHKYTWFSGGLTVQGERLGREANEIRGSFKLTDEKTIEDEIEGLNSYISSVKFAADKNELSIGNVYSYIDSLTGEVEEKVSWSYIKQHADEINLQVIEGLKQTGIDIKSGQITMDADNTKFLGNISMYNSNNGLIIYDENAIPRVVLNRDKIQKSGDNYVPNNMNKIAKQSLDMSRYAKLGGYFTETKEQYKAKYQNTLNNVFLGHFTNSETFKLHIGLSIRFQNQDMNKSVYDIPSWKSSDKGTYKMTYKVYSGSTTIASGTETLRNTNGKDINVTCSKTGDYYLDWSVDYKYDIDQVANDYTFYTIGEYIDCQITKGTNGMTFIGTNGIFSSQNLNRYMVYCEDGFKVVEKHDGSITIGNDGHSHSISEPRYALGVDKDKGPYWCYGSGTNEQLSSGWTVPIGVPKLITLSSSDFTNQSIYNESGSTITVKGYNVNANIYTQIIVNSVPSSGDIYIILPYAEPAQVLIFNYSNRDIYVHARCVDNSYKNIYINKKKTNRNTGEWRYVVEQSDECLWMIGDRYGWNNLSLMYDR